MNWIEKHLKSICLIIIMITMTYISIRLGLTRPSKSIGWLKDSSMTNNTVLNNIDFCFKLLATVVGIFAGSSIFVYIIHSNHTKITNNDIKILKPFKDMVIYNMKCMNRNKKYNKYIIEYYCYSVEESMRNNTIDKNDVLRELLNIDFDKYLKNYINKRSKHKYCQLCLRENKLEKNLNKCKGNKCYIKKKKEINNVSNKINHIEGKHLLLSSRKLLNKLKSINK